MLNMSNLAHASFAADKGLTGASFSIEHTQGRQLQDACLAIKSALGKHELLSRVLSAIVLDQSHPLNVARALMDEERRSTVLNEISEIANFRQISTKEMEEAVDVCRPAGNYLFERNNHEFLLRDKTGKPIGTSDYLLGLNRHLYSIAVAPSQEQQMLLSAYALRLTAEIIPKLRRSLTRLAGDKHEHGYPLVNARAKSVDGILDKIQRMRQKHNFFHEISQHSYTF